MGDTFGNTKDIRTAIRELSRRAELADREGRAKDAEELRGRIRGYQEQLAERP